MGLARPGTEGRLEVGGFLNEKDTTILLPSIVCRPGFGLGHDFVGTHHGLSRKQPQETDLGEAAEAKSSFDIERFEPGAGCRVVNVAAIGQGDPDVHIREKE